MKELKISSSTPRDTKIINEVPVFKGIIKYYTIIFGMLIMGIAVFMSCFFPPIESGLITFKTIASIGLIISAYFLFKKYSSKADRRKDALINGSVVTGTIVVHGRKFNPTSSTKHYTVKIRYKSNGKEKFTTLIRSNKKIYSDLPIHSETYGLVILDSENSIFFPVEIDIKLVFL
jgi:hypothetical protein